MKKGALFGSIIAAFICAVLWADVSAQAWEIEKKGKFVLSGNTLIVNRSDKFTLDGNTVIVNAKGAAIDRLQLKVARIVRIDTDGRSYAKKITVVGWYH